MSDDVQLDLDGRPADHPPWRRPRAPVGARPNPENPWPNSHGTRVLAADIRRARAALARMEAKTNGE